MQPRQHQQQLHSQQRPLTSPIAPTVTPAPVNQIGPALSTAIPVAALVSSLCRWLQTLRVLLSSACCWLGHPARYCADVFTHSAPTFDLFQQRSHNISALVRLSSNTSGTVSLRPLTASVPTLTCDGATASAGTQHSDISLQRPCSFMVAPALVPMVVSTSLYASCGPLLVLWSLLRSLRY